MFYFLDMCVICLEHSTNLMPIKSQDTNGIIIEDKLKYILPKHKFNPNILRYICVRCGNNLRYDNEFKQKCLKNITTYEKYAQQVTTTDSSYKYLSVVIRSDFVIEEVEISDGNNYDTNILESQSEIDVDTVNNEDFIIKEEYGEELVLNDELKSLLHEFKEEYSKSDDIRNILTENVQISDNSASLPTENENMTEQDGKEQYECYVCHKTYFTKVKLKKHILLHSMANKSRNKEKGTSNSVFECFDKSLLKYTCKICKKSFRLLSDLKKHCSKCTHEKQFTCEVCNKSLAHLKSLKCHKLIHNYRERPFTCEVCNKSFTGLTGLKKHKLIHTGKKPFTCEVCKKSFGRLDTLKYHKLIHDRKKPFTCDVCNKSFTQSASLKFHKIIHTGKKPFSCEVCKKSFRRLDSLKCHKVTHTGERPYTCEVCNKSYSHSSHLWKHRLIHTSENPFACEVCKQSFRYLKQMKKHCLTHSDEKSFTCDVCSTSFTTEKQLQSHLKIHKYKCAECPENFSLKSTLKKHIFDAHRKNNKPVQKLSSVQLQASNSLIEENTQKNNQQLRIHNGTVPYFCKHCCKSFKQLIHFCSYPKNVNEAQK